MKNITQIKWILLLTVGATFAQQEKGIMGNSNWLNNWTEFKPGKVEYNDSNQILFGNITANTVLYKKNTYLLQGTVYISNNATLTIEAGTVIKGDSESNGTLVITKGASIIADGKETDPIVFTSNKAVKKAGDWGGIVMLGDAPINKFGGTASLPLDLDPSKTLYGGLNVSYNGGVLRYVRIEFAGRKVKGFKEFNSLTLAGVGNKTIIDNVMCSFSGDDSFEVCGGEVNITKGISYKALDDDFDFTQGAQVNLDNSLAVRSSYVSATGSRCIEIDSYERKEDADFTKKLTSVVASNITMLNDSNNLDVDIAAGLIKEAVRIAENSLLTIRKSVISGFNPAITLDNKIEIKDANFKRIKLEDIYFNNCKGNIYTENNTNNEDLEDYYGNTAFGNTWHQGLNKETFIDIANPKQPDYRIKLSKITASNSK
jgi:hypothetical protein